MTLQSLLPAILLPPLLAAEPFSLTLLHVNDTHSNLVPVSLQVVLPDSGGTVRLPVGGVARLAREVRRLREEEPNTLFLHAGDLVQGTLYYTVYGGRADAAVYNAMAPEAMTLGNHEFDRGSAGLDLLLSEVRFPLICANVDVSGDTLLAGRIPPWLILETGGERVGIFGLITGELASVSSPSPETRVLPLLETARETVDLLQAQGVNKIVVLSHIGYAHDLELAASLSGVDVIVGGHSHTLLGDFEDLGLASEGPYPTVVEGPDGETVLVVTAWRHGMVLGNLNVEFDPEGRITRWTGDPVILTGPDAPALPGLRRTEDDPLVRELVDVYTEALDDFQREYVATAESDLPHLRVPGGTLPEGSRIAPIVCDAMLWKANLLGIGADIALQNAGGVRIDVPRGEITLGTVYSLLPFGNTLAVLDLTGADLRNLLEEALSSIFDQGRSDGTFPYVAGLAYEASRSAAAGARVGPIRLLTPEGPVPLDPERTYRLVTNTFVAGGGDGYGSLSGRPFTDTGFVDAEVLAEYLRHLGSVIPVEARVFLTE